ncbi:hypothetical protein [Nocardia nova]|uniref:hypothetical protein n=1 Tax=Nocardia nova TaxID=37330 RepID=UPI0018936C7C|nr:hypothetical protein [Nocardia nova]MBF6150270.1 hypothetical protein [Nocardia nova]
MSRGLGLTQRVLLTALGIAETSFGGRAFAFADHEGDWTIVSRLRLVETEHPKRFPTTRTTKAADREFKRSERSPYRRALQTLTQRGLIESKLTPVDLRILGQYSWPGRAQRSTWLARLTDRGFELLYSAPYPELSRSIYGRLEDALVFNDSEDRAELLQESLYWSFPRKMVAPPARRTEVPAPTISPAPPKPKVDLTKDEAIEALCAEGFEIEQVKAALRTWHRAEQRRYREDFDVSAPALDDCVFDRDDLEGLRQQIRISE